VIKLRKLSVVFGAIAASLAFAASAQAAIVTVGSTATVPLSSATIGNPATIINSAVGSPGAILTSPVSGVIVRWNVTGFVGGPFRLRVLTPLGGTGYMATGTSAPMVPVSTATHTTPTNLPIAAGQMVAVDNANASDQEGYIASPGGSYSFFVPPLADGASDNAVGPFPGAEFLFNAEVQPVPGISAVSPAKGSYKGGTVVLIGGHDFTGASAVKFGATPAAIYSVESDSLIRAVAPANPKPGRVDVSVTTIAGTTAPGATSSFTYTACVVPKLAGKKLKAAKKRIRKAGCKLGEVTKLEGVTGKTGVVVKQNPKPGKVRPPGARVSVKLGQ
jgi:IPT/TIG domain-containing protein/PASTA domain-containing protein